MTRLVGSETVVGANTTLHASSAQNFDFVNGTEPRFGTQDPNIFQVLVSPTSELFL